MFERRLYILIFAIAIITLAGSSRGAVGGNWEEFPVATSAEDQENPDIDGDIVVWQQLITDGGDYDIYVADLNREEAVFEVFGDVNDQTNPAVFGNRVVWQDFIIWQDSQDWDIRMADFTEEDNPTVYLVTDIAYNDEMKPAIHGNIVVWQDGADGVYDVYGSDITNPSSPAEFEVAPYEGHQGSPAVFRNTVVWEDDYFGDLDVIAADIWLRDKPEENPISFLEYNQGSPVISGRTVVYQDDFFGDWDIYAVRIGEPNNSPEITIAAELSDQLNPDIDGNLVVFQDDRNGNWDIYGYNLTTGRQFPITDNEFDQVNPAISGNTVVFQDNRSGGWDIYAVRLNGPATARCPNRPAGDTNGDCRFDFTDLAIAMDQWLACNLIPAGACGGPAVIEAKRK